MSSTRLLVAITSLCSLALFSSCSGLDSTETTPDCTKTGTCQPDAGLDSQPFDSPVVRDVIPDLRDGSAAATDGRPDGAVGAEAGPDDGSAPALDGGDTDATSDDDALADASTDDTAPSSAEDGGDDGQGDADQGDAPILAGTCAINGQPAPAGTVCRAANGLCDVAEYCDGASTVCPLDRFLAKDQVCRPTAGDCDRAEVCTGTSPDCPADAFLAKGATCRAAVSICDLAEYCDGTSATCPVDLFAPATIKCRPSTDDNVCDPPEFCTGAANQCPPDAIYTPPTAPPIGVAVTPGDLLADVSWTAITGDAGAGVTGYNVKSSTVTGTGFAIRGSPTASPFTVTSLNTTQTFYFVVSAYSGQPSCESPNSSQVSAMSCVATAPTGLAATLDNAGRVVLTWTAPSGAVASYSLSRSTISDGVYTVVPGAGALLTTTFTDSPVVASSGTTTFYYVVRANTGTCLSPYSSTPATAVIVSVSPDGGADAATGADAGAGPDADTDASADDGVDAVTD